jgi:molecular chaperone HscB
MHVLNNAETGGQCWSCGDMRAAQFCSSCGKVQPTVATDYFAFFGLPRKLNVDTAALEREMYALSRKLHPDKFVGASAREQEWSLEQSSMLNDAYRTLRDPIDRTEYLLKLEGVHLQDQSTRATEAARASGTAKRQVVPPDLLEEVFDLNMELEELRASRVTGKSDPDLMRELRAAKANFQDKLDDNSKCLRAAWNDWDALITREEKGDAVSDAERRRVRDRMVDLLNRRSYISNLVREVNAELS